LVECAKAEGFASALKKLFDDEAEKFLFAGAEEELGWLG